MGLLDDVVEWNKTQATESPSQWYGDWHPDYAERLQRKEEEHSIIGLDTGPRPRLVALA